MREIYYIDTFYMARNFAYNRLFTNVLFHFYIEVTCLEVTLLNLTKMI